MSKFKTIPDLPEEIDEGKWNKAKSLIRLKKKSGLAKLLKNTEQVYGNLSGQKPYQQIDDFYENLFDIYEDLEIENTHILKIQYHVKNHEDFAGKIKIVMDRLDSIVETCDTLIDQHGSNKVARLANAKMLTYLADLKKSAKTMKGEFPEEEDLTQYKEDVAELRDKILTSKSLLKHAMGDMVKFLKVQSKNRISAIKEGLTNIKSLKDKEEDTHEQIVTEVNSVSGNVHHIFRGGGLQLRQYHENKLSKPEVLQVLEDTEIEAEAKRLFDIAGEIKRGADSSYLSSMCKDDLEEKNYDGVVSTLDNEIKVCIAFLKGTMALMREIQVVFKRL